MAEETSYQTDTYYRVKIQNDNVGGDGGGISYISIDGSVNFLSTDVNSESSSGLSAGTYIYFVKKGGSVVLSVRKGSKGFLGFGSYKVSLKVDDEIKVTGTTTEGAPYTLGVTGPHTVLCAKA